MAKKNAKTILVTGATGHQGGAAVRHLREKGFSVRALTRDPASPGARALVGHGTEVVRGDLEDLPSLTRALDEVAGVYSVQSLMDHETEVRQGINLIDAAVRARVSHFVYSSVASADQKTGIPHFQSKFRIEERLRSCGVAYTILRPVFFMENWLRLREPVGQGTLAFPLGPDTRLQMIAVDDIGAFVTAAFEKPGHWQGRTMEIAADELSMTEIASAFSRIVGSEVRYHQIPWNEYDKMAGHDLTLMFQWLDSVGYHIDIPAVRRELPNLAGFGRWLQANWNKAMTA